MALSYSTGSLVGLDNLWDTLDAWLTGSAGWTKIETVNSRDAVYTSTGADGKVNMTFRVSTSTSAANLFKNAANVHKVFPWIIVQGYNQWTVGAPGSGTKPFGQVGPWAFGLPVSGGVITADTARIHRFNGTFPLTSTADTTWPGRTRRTNSSSPFENMFSCFDGRRKLIGANRATNTQIGWCDLSHGESNLSSGGIPPGNLETIGSPSVLVHDAVNDTDLVYLFNNTATLAIQFLKYNIETNTWSTMSGPGWTASATAGSSLVWDGSDTIYALHGNGTTEFAKYSISGNTWTSLTAAPQARPSTFATSSTGCSTNMIYVPNSVTGIGQDVIYTTLLASGTVFYRYRVTDNAWDSTSGTGALTAQQTIAANTFLVWDGIKYIYHGTPATATIWYRSDASSAPNTWTSMGAVQSTTRSYATMQLINHYPCKIRSHATATTTYWFLGDADSVTVVVKVGTATPHYYWMYFGRFSSSNRPDIMTLSSGASAGGQATVTVDDTTKYSVGESCVIWDPSNGNSEKVVIQTIPTGTTFTTNLVNNYASGSRVGIDPTQWICGANGMGLCPTDASGYGSDNEPAQYVLEASTDSLGTLRSSPCIRSLYQPVPIAIFNDDNTTQKYENRGYLKNTYASSTGAYPMAQSESTILVAGKTYLYFKDTETSRYTTDTRGLIIGPID